MATFSITTDAGDTHTVTAGSITISATDDDADGAPAAQATQPDATEPAPIQGSAPTGSIRFADAAVAPDTAQDAETGSVGTQDVSAAALGDTPEGVTVEVLPESMAELSLSDLADLTTPGGPRGRFTVQTVDESGAELPEHTVTADSLGEAVQEEADAGATRVTVLRIEHAGDDDDQAAADDDDEPTDEDPGF